jgi:hypothetical protein
MVEAAGDGGLVAEKADGASTEERGEPRGEHVEAREDGGHESL